MYFHVKKSPTSEVLQLLEAYRNAKGQSRHHVVVSLGNCQIRESDRGEIASGVDAELYKSPLLFSPTPEQQQWIDSIVKRIQRRGRWKPSQSNDDDSREKSGSEYVDGVAVDDIEHTDDTSLGPELLGLHAWECLNIDGLLQSLKFSKSQRDAACVSVINRLVDPVSENRLKQWLGSSSLEDLLDSDVLSGTENRYYRISDKLLDNQDEIEGHLRRNVKGHFNFQRTLLLYDLTNTHFEGTCKLNGKAKRGRNKQKRHDCPQVAVGVCFDEHGFVQFHKTFSGNTNDSTTLLEMVLKMEGCREGDLFDSKLKPLVIVDAGIATVANLSILREKGFDYLVNESRQGRQKYKEHFEGHKTNFDLIEGRDSKSPVKVKTVEIDEHGTIFPLEESSAEAEEVKLNSRVSELLSGQDSQVDSDRDRLVLCHSAQRGQKEMAIFNNAEEKLIKDLEVLHRRIDKGKLVDSAKIERAIGKIQGKHPRVARYYDIKMETQIEETPLKKSKSGNSPTKRNKAKTPKANVVHSLHWTNKAEEVSEKDELFGCYVLRTSRHLPAVVLWHLYMILSMAESGFRALKSDLGLRPNYHHLEPRVDGHIFITILAYQLQRFILYTLSQSGDNRSWTTLKLLLRSHTYSTMLIPTNQDKLYRIRKAGRPDIIQRQIYRNLNVDLKNLPKSKIIIPKKSTTS